MGKTKQKQDRSHYLFSNRELANLIGPLVIEQLLAVFVGMAVPSLLYIPVFSIIYCKNVIHHLFAKKRIFYAC